MVNVLNFFYAFCYWECCSKYWIPQNMTKLDIRMKDELMGQPLAHNLIHTSIKAHINAKNPPRALVFLLHGSTGTGKNFISKLIVESLYKKGYKSGYVRLYVASRDFMHDDEHSIQEYKGRIMKDIEEGTSTCEHATFIFDEVDKPHVQSLLLETILFYTHSYTPRYPIPIDFRKTIFIFLSNTGATEINRIVHKYHSGSIKRQDFKITEFQNAFANTARSEPGGLWHGLLSNRNLETFFVPFLPLERSHVRTCVQRQLAIVRKHEEYQYKLSDNDIVAKVLDLIEFSPPDAQLYSVSGCKKVAQKLDFILEGIRMKPVKTKSEF
ncbi:unnamed protein product [Adineta steineri]|uniref:Torsin-1A C-terminal domain-containing protein n=1 Tax=Adineta steineri TaxID=433720 RepID=A0A818PCD0_9BILA|nr:unnamed protein product [Adineta steineri]CAF3617930.1 unnamed protein product [Adineta steineri]